MKKIIIVISAMLSFLFIKSMNKSIPENEDDLFKDNKGEEKQLNLNTAGAETLMSIPGIGPDLSYKIEDYKKNHGNLNDLNELLNVKGIGEKKLEEIKPYLKIE
ncbi:ComEA family DNA-binding protein [Salisediminibacterium beveridgei]|uniref:Late competence protein ComEA, DNA receptor n=1 Tax=Salisediminibacterium beveridgei TaxID=632773 RepID=A0A1D7QS97_9BACI|nr:helix-hairpin-helix domain-containing protein [Salisediminibacterium beveridgei]AOM81890.1 Late competence protein ComEA, DNA receptor [Salisediminibacterium beveridgei]